MTAREAVAGARRLVVKIGSTSLTSVDGGLDVGRLDALVDAVAARAAGTQVVLVSSGAIAAGLRPLGLPRRPRDLATQQAAAGVGQLHLTRAYAEAFARHGRTVGQVLLTSHDVVRRQPYRNAQRTFERLLGLGVVPVVNENDTVATDEIRFGDNDRLAALVAHVISADALVLLSDVAGVYDADPRDPGATLVREVTGGADLAGVRVGKTSSLGTGGMASKLAAADLASGAGVPVLVAAAADARAALDGAEVGTVFAPHGPRLSARRFWLRHMAGTRGRLHLDAGAVKAVVGRRRSLLAAGIVGSDGDFEAGDVVDLVDPRGDVVARGVVAFDAEELPEDLRTVQRGPGAGAPAGGRARGRSRAGRFDGRGCPMPRRPIPRARLLRRPTPPPSPCPDPCHRSCGHQPLELTRVPGAAPRAASEGRRVVRGVHRRRDRGCVGGGAQARPAEEPLPPAGIVLAPALVGQGPRPRGGAGPGERLEDPLGQGRVVDPGAGADLEATRGRLSDPPPAVVLGAVVVAVPDTEVPGRRRAAQGVVDRVVEVGLVRGTSAAGRDAVPVADPDPAVDLGAWASACGIAGLLAAAGGRGAGTSGSRCWSSASSGAQAPCS